MRWVGLACFVFVTSGAAPATASSPMTGAASAGRASPGTATTTIPRRGRCVHRKTRRAGACLCRRSTDGGHVAHRPDREPRRPTAVDERGPRVDRPPLQSRAFPGRACRRVDDAGRRCEPALRPHPAPECAGRGVHRHAGPGQRTAAPYDRRPLWRQAADRPRRRCRPNSRSALPGPRVSHRDRAGRTGDASGPDAHGADLLHRVGPAGQDCGRENRG